MMVFTGTNPSIDSLPVMDYGEPLAVDSDLLDTSEEDEDSSDWDNTLSMTSSIYDYNYENGRTYHRYKEGAYMLPNDETEQDRLDLMHRLYLIMLDGNLFMSPIKDLKRVLDVGTGTGIWAIDVADTYPDSEVTGTDLSPIQPPCVPPNCQFEIDDMESIWTYPLDHFDFIHSRHMAQSIKEWDHYIDQVFVHTKPGGWAEFCEFDWTLLSDDGSYTTDLNLYKYMTLTAEAMNKAGYNVDIPKQLGMRLKRRGFINVTVHTRCFPWAPWPKDPKMKSVGFYSLAAMSSTGFEAYGLALLTRYGGMEAEDAMQLCSLGLQDVKNKSIHVYNTHYWVTGRRPMPGEQAKKKQKAHGT